ncbi:MAG: hypothetical protein K5780_05795 [Alphaproteobacteria bacterium]|nr:hypothetical protein [Alphaproteobacteria bacterium]
MKIFNYLMIICGCVEVFCLEPGEFPAIVSIENPDNLRIIDQIDNTEIERFHVSVFSNPRKCADGSLEFVLKTSFENFNEIVRFDNEIIKDTVNGKLFCVVIPKNELENKIFFREIRLTPDNSKFKLDKIKLKIEPKVAISADQKKVDFGGISHNGTRLASENSPTVVIRYSILKDAVCEVNSKNNFRLKNKENYISYSVNGLTQNGEIYFLSDQNQYVANFKITDSGKRPVAGTYTDKITFSIKTQL